MKWIQPLQKWGWVALKTTPDWNEIQKCVDDLIAKKIIDVSIEKDIHAEYALLKPIVDGLIPKWDEEEKKRVEEHKKKEKKKEEAAKKREQEQKKGKESETDQEADAMEEKEKEK